MTDTQKTGSNSVIWHILGLVSSPNAQVRHEPFENSTRWVFDVQHDGGEPVLVQLRHRYESQRIRAAVQSFSVAPMSEECFESKIWLQENSDGTFAIHACKACRVRIAVDLIHSATR